MKKLLPIGIQTLSEIINENYIYVDKTETIYKLITEGKYYFLSRPRRFGKSLTVSTLEEIFSGNKELFKDCWICNSDWKWNKYPILKIDFSSVGEKNTVEADINLLLKNIYQKNEIEFEDNLSLNMKMSFLIQKLFNKYNQKVVILIDEYDKIIVNNLTNKNIAEKNRDILRDLFSPIKPNDGYIKFCFLTGVSRFGRASVFSTLNNIQDISITDKYSNLCGYTEVEIIKFFDEYINEASFKFKKNKIEMINQIRNWYNGYNFSTNSNIQKTYNPFSIINFFSILEFNNFWIDSGKTKFLFDFFTLKNYENVDFENIQLDKNDLNISEIDDIKLETLLLQTGYLTIESYDEIDFKFKLKFPNFEVRSSFNKGLLQYIYKYKKSVNFSFLIKIKKSIENCEFKELFEYLEIFFSGVSYDIQIDQEKYYQSLLYVLFDLANIRAKTEEHTNVGRIDLIIETKNNFCIIELKLNKTAEIAIEQVKNRKYYQKYLKYNKDIYIFGINFNSEINNINEYLFEKI